jgi:hypothetical protein
MVVAENQMIRVFLGGETKSHDLRDHAIFFEADIRMPRLLLDNRFPGKQDGSRRHRSDETREHGIVKMAENNRLLSLQRQERSEVVYIHGFATKEYRPPTRANEA